MVKKEAVHLLQPELKLLSSYLEKYKKVTEDHVLFIKQYT